MKLIEIVKSERPDKKYKAVFESDSGRQKVTHFGAEGMDDFTLTKNTAQRERYRLRHEKDLETEDPTRAGYLSWYLLWNKPSLTESIKDYKRKFDL